MADSECTSGKMALIPRRHKKQSKLALCPDASLESNLFNKLCDELLAEILLRLSRRAAVRFQVVCKRWYSLISSRYFIARFIHIRHHRDVQSSLVFQFRYYCDRTCNSGGCKQYHSDFQIISDCSLLRKVYGERVFRLSYLPCPPRDLHNVELEGSFADLILRSSITHTKETNYYVSNLLTRQWIALPPAPAHAGFMEAVSTGFLCVPPPCYECKPVDKFMVVRLRTDESRIPRSRFKVQVFSSQDGQWRTLVVSSPLTLKGHVVKTSLVAYRGMLHWLNTDCIVVYDPLNTPERFSRIIDLPVQLPFLHSLRKATCFGVTQGRLRVVEISGDDAVDPVLDVWELEDYDSGLWNLVHKVYLKNLIYNSLPIAQESLHSELCSFSVVSLHPENGDVVYLRMRNANGIVPVNMKSRTIEHYYPIKKNAVFSWVNAFHLADQWWPTAVSSLH